MLKTFKKLFQTARKAAPIAAKSFQHSEKPLPERAFKSWEKVFNMFSTCFQHFLLKTGIKVKFLPSENFFTGGRVFFPKTD
jgi:hypothetical protein